MKNLFTITVLFSALLLSPPGRADCPLGKESKKAVPAAKHEAAVKHPSFTPEPEPFWHDLHWFE